DHDAKPGFNFTGWTVTDANGNEVIVNGGKFTMPASDVTVKANYVAIQYIITVDNGTADKNEAPMGEAVTITANAPADGYEFDYWEITNGEGASMNNANASSTILRVGTSNVNVRANYRLVDYTITVNNGTANKTTANMNELVTITANNPAIGYEFTGWTLVSGTGAQITSVTSNETTITVGTGNVEVTANYKLTEYIITTHNATSNFSTATYETTVSLTADTKPGYTFESWTTNPEVSVTFTNTFVMPASDIDVTANFTPNTYTIEYVNNGGVGTTVDQDATYDVDITILSNTGFTKAGYEFISWNTQPDGSGDTYYQGSTQKNLATEGTITLYAQWEIAGFIITFNNNGGKGSMPTQQINYDKWDYLSKCKFTKTGYKFTAWNLKPDGTGKSYADEEYVSNITAGEAVTLYAQWAPVDYYVAFDSNAEGDPVSGSMANQLFRFDDAEPLNTNVFARSGYTFTGWNRNEAGTSTDYADGEVVKNLASEDGEIVSLYAQWTANTYRIVFKANDGTGKMDDEIMTYGIEANLTPNAFTRDGYTFAGWATSADGKGARYENKQAVKNLVGDNNGEIKLYAQWTPITYTVVFYANNAKATGTTESQKFTYDEAKTLSKNGFVIDGHTFLGWSTSINGAVEYIDEQTVVNITNTPDATISLYAVWTANAYYIVFDGNGNTGGSMARQQVVFDESVFLNNNAYTRLGFTFNGWNTAADGSGSAYIDHAVVSNLTTEANGVVTLYAQWKAGIYTVTTDQFTTSNVAAATMGTVVTLTPIYREGYEFVGWTTKPATITISEDNTFEMPASDVEVITLFNVSTYTITYNGVPDGVENNNRTLYSIIDDDITLENITRSGYIFLGWFDELGNQITVIPSGSVGNLNLTAKWKADIDIDCIDSKPFITWNMPSDYKPFITCENDESIVVEITTPQGNFANCNGKVFTGNQIMNYVNYTFFVNGVKMQSDTLNTFTLPDEGIPSKGIVDVAVSLIEDTLTYHISYEIRHRFIRIMWDDVLSVINSDEYFGKELTLNDSFTWYREGESTPIAENKMFYDNKGVSLYNTGTYYLVVVTTEGEVYTSCPKYTDDRGMVAASSLVAYPNPSSGVVNVKGGTWDVGDEITVVNESGQTVIVRTAESATKDKVDLSGLPQGTYVIRIGNDVVSVIKR
ncbi:MAG: InlB B-repeat-containing protein, partial [Bacteroidales bacterium]|nr:InlB B-repeat-containing protein [Bacteroidales bacterium]